MKRRLKIYFIHSTKYDYNDIIYKPVLLSSVCVPHDLILPLSNNYKNKYAKDLINKADIIIAEVSKKSFGLKFELKWALASKKPVLYYSLTNEVPKSLRKYVPNLELTDDNKPCIKIIENFITKYADISKEEAADPVVVLGEI